jgi:hypothetical protein
VKPKLVDDDIAQILSIQSRLDRLERGEGIITGQIVLWRDTTPIPSGWLACDGSTFDALLYPALSSLWGTDTLPVDPGLSGYFAIVRAR